MDAEIFLAGNPFLLNLGEMLMNFKESKLNNNRNNSTV